MKIAEKRSKVNAACTQHGVTLLKLFEDAYRATHHSQCDAELVKKQVADFRAEKGHPPGYLLEYIRQRQSSFKASQPKRSRRDTRTRQPAFATAAAR